MICWAAFMLSGKLLVSDLTILLIVVAGDVGDACREVAVILMDALLSEEIFFGLGISSIFQNSCKGIVDTNDGRYS